MATVKRNQPPLVSTEAANRIRSFAHDLAALCNSYRIDIRGNSWGDIEVRDGARPSYPEGYEYDATFWGCGLLGIYHHSAGAWASAGPIRLMDLLPEDWYVAEAKR